MPTSANKPCASADPGSSANARAGWTSWRRASRNPAAPRNAVSPWEAGAPRSAASRWEAAANPWLGAIARCSRTGRFYGAGGEDVATSLLQSNRWSAAMPQPNDLSRSVVALDQNSTIIAVVEMSQSSWLVGGMLPGIERQPCKKLEPRPERLLAVLHRWRDEAVKAGRTITRIALAFEAGRDGFWLARWLAARGVEAHVIHPLSVAVSREHRRAKTDRIDTELLKRGFLGWLRGERGHCSMARVPTLAEEDAKRPNRERDCLVGERTRIVNRIKSTLARLGIRTFKPTLRKAADRLATVHTPEGVPLPPNTLAELQRDMARLGLVVSQIRQIEEARQKRLEQQHETGPHAMVRLLARIVGVGVETADMLVHEVLSRTAEPWPAEPVLGPAKGRTRGPA